MTELRRVKIAPKGMGLNDFVAEKEGFFAAEGLDVATSGLTRTIPQCDTGNFTYSL